jgi:hypothetical protein
VKIKIVDQEGHRTLRYCYDVNRYMSCEFSLLCEVGQPWMNDAKQVLSELCCAKASKVVQVELTTRPWYADALVPV